MCFRPFCFWPALLFVAICLLRPPCNRLGPWSSHSYRCWLNSILFRAERHVELPPIVFIHGASASLYDPMLSFREKLEGRASDIGGEQNIPPDGQADAIAALMAKRKIGRAIVVSHSFGGAIAANLETRHPDLDAGLVFLSPAVYPRKAGDADGIVPPDIHARHLARDIGGSRLIVVHNLGHKSDYVACDLVIEAIETVAGKKVELMSVVKKLEQRIANDGEN